MRSMTGYGQARWQKGGQRIAVEVRSVNQRFVEVRLNMPRQYLAWEAELRSLVQRHVARGKVDVLVSRSGPKTAKVAVEADLGLARAYLAALRRLQRALGVPGTIDIGFLQSRGDLLRLVERRDEAQREIVAVRATLRRALARLVRERVREGRVLRRDMTMRTRRLARLRVRMSRRAAKQTPELAARARRRLTTLLEGAGVSADRMVQEAALLAERADVTEELVRLKSHLEGLAALLRRESVVGKQLEFLLQEVHREVNTIGSKSADLALTGMALEARAEIEKLREQAQNVE